MVGIKVGLFGRPLTSCKESLAGSMFLTSPDIASAQGLGSGCMSLVVCSIEEEITSVLITH